MINQKNMFFKKNGGLLLQQQLASHEANIENTTLFNSNDSEKATDRFLMSIEYSAKEDKVRFKKACWQMEELLQRKSPR
jgi:hypothetical protein